MMSTPSFARVAVAPGSKPDRFGPRVFWPVLLLAAVVGLIIRLEVARKTFISFDEWQHLFMAGSARWTDLAFELRTNAHPPLFFLLLRGVVRLGIVNTLLYRSISISAGVGSIIVVGLIARRIFRSPVVQLLCAAVFALSADAISVSVEIRSYQLTVFLVLLAYLFWLGRPRPVNCIAFAICSSLAVSSHYSAAFFLGACLLVSPLKFRWLAACALAVPCAVFAVEYFVHASVQPIQGYLADFYLGATPNETAVDFIARNSRNFFNLFSPVEIRNEAAFLVVFLVLCALVAWVLFQRPDVAAPILFAIVMVLELLAASLARKYPFGGMLRHQYIAGPFLLIAAFAIVDVLLPVAGPILRRALPALLLAASIANLIVEGPKLILYPGLDLLKAEFDSWRAAFPNAQAVYLDHWAAICYFIHTSNRPRVFVRRVADEAVIDEYRVPGSAEIFYDKTHASLNFADPSVYQSLVACLRESGAKELTLLFYSPGDVPIDQSPDTLKATIVRRAADQGLVTTRIVVARTTLAAGFKLRTD